MKLINIRLTINLISTFVSLIARDMKKLYVSNIVDYETVLVSEIVLEEFFDWSILVLISRSASSGLSPLSPRACFHRFCYRLVFFCSVSLLHSTPFGNSRSLCPGIRLLALESFSFFNRLSRKDMFYGFPLE
jgi:hypothetical protein